jgi:hypothetical protein
MTDEIRITRRVALDKEYEFYEFQLTIVDPKEKDLDSAIKLFEKKVGLVRQKVEKPSPENSPEKPPVKHPPPKKEQEEEPKHVTYEIIHDKYYFYVPFDLKDSFKDLVKAEINWWPKWNKDFKAWTLDTKKVTNKLMDTLHEAELMGARE